MSLPAGSRSANPSHNLAFQNSINSLKSVHKFLSYSTYKQTNSGQSSTCQSGDTYGIQVLKAATFLLFARCQQLSAVCYGESLNGVVLLMLQFAKLALQQGVLGQMPPPYAPAPQAFIVPQYPGNFGNNRPNFGSDFSSMLTKVSVSWRFWVC